MPPKVITQYHKELLPSDLSDFLEDLDTLSVSDLTRLVEGFAMHLYSSLVKDGSAEVFRLINLNKEGFCLQTVTHLMDTVCSAKYYGADDLMYRYTEEVANLQRGCNMKMLTTADTK